jgi:hypothetical protein
MQSTSTSLDQNCRPGNGWGDANHCHSGPPGQSDGHGDNHGDNHGNGDGNNHTNKDGFQHGGTDSAHFRLIGFTTSSGVRWVFVTVGVGFVLMALALQRRMRRLW